ncbi:Aste57867_10775 [Aphanomyces stellatus]|uniref:Aste57867_10775 protein n=1 Tax=Aphanomyces stellatus TaxID=120398 RepID=A0A485KRD2_9STRA|nr:hypothetical protein As57867_010735 [Aphanomyces stellatus]VFT87645.1 Aste57867_10775 [Aphanomyces stellatus]
MDSATINVSMPQEQTTAPGQERLGSQGLSRLQSIFRLHGGGGGGNHQVRHRDTVPQERKVTDETINMRLQAIWQLLVTGFELIKYPNAGPSRKRVLWLTLDGRLCVGRSKSDKHAGKFMHLWDVETVAKGCDAAQFSKSLSWRDARGKEQLCWSIDAEAKHGAHTFALQVTTNNVRNILVENLAVLVSKMHGDHDGEYPKNARVRIAKHFASTGEVLSMVEVRALMTRLGSDAGNLDLPEETDILGVATEARPNTHDDSDSGDDE